MTNCDIKRHSLIEERYERLRSAAQALMDAWETREPGGLGKAIGDLEAVLAAARSATPDQDVIDQEKRDASLAAFYGLAGSARTPTCPVRGDHMLRSTQEACPACGDDK